MYVVAVLFEIQDGHAADFNDAILRNAAASRQEPGCKQFDVAFSEDGLACFLYELYDDRAAFDAHLATPHFLKFREATEPWTLNFRLETYKRVEVQ